MWTVWLSSGTSDGRGKKSLAGGSVAGAAGVGNEPPSTELTGMEAEERGLWLAALRATVCTVRCASRFVPTFVQDFELAGGYETVGYMVRKSSIDRLPAMLEQVCMTAACNLILSVVVLVYMLQKLCFYCTCTCTFNCTCTCTCNCNCTCSCTCTMRGVTNGVLSICSSTYLYVYYMTTGLYDLYDCMGRSIICRVFMYAWILCIYMVYHYCTCLACTLQCISMLSKYCRTQLVGSCF